MSLGVRVGIGYDSHRFVEGHGVLLGGAGLGDIGEMFPDTAAENKNRDSLEMLRLAVARIRAAGWEPAQADLTVIAETPKIGPHRPAIRERLAEAIGIAPGEVMVKGKTNERMGWVGRGEGIAVMAVATLVQSES